MLGGWCIIYLFINLMPFGGSNQRFRFMQLLESLFRLKCRILLG